jgi:hypothetical protein
MDFVDNQPLLQVILQVLDVTNVILSWQQMRNELLLLVHVFDWKVFKELLLIRAKTS